MNAILDLESRIKILGPPSVLTERASEQLRGWLFPWQDQYACVVFCVDTTTSTVTLDEATQHPSALAALKKLTGEFEKFEAHYQAGQRSVTPLVGEIWATDNPSYPTVEILYVPRGRRVVEVENRMGTSAATDMLHFCQLTRRIRPATNSSEEATNETA